MRAKGIGYDTGFERDGQFNRPFDPDLVRRELVIIHDELHCTAVRLIGTDLDRIEFAAREAAALGLEVWFSPFPWDRRPGRSSTSSPTALRGRSGFARRAPRSCSSPGPS